MDTKDTIPPKIYRNMLAKNYKETKKDYQKILQFQKRIYNPICPKEDRFIPQKTRGNILTQEYLKKMKEKPEKAHKKIIPIKGNLTSGVIVMTEPNEPLGRKIKQEQVHRASSAQKRRLGKKIVLDNYKKFYYDDFDSSKINKTQIQVTKNKKVRKLLYNNFPYQFLEPIPS